MQVVIARHHAKQAGINTINLPPLQEPLWIYKPPRGVVRDFLLKTTIFQQYAMELIRSGIRVGMEAFNVQQWGGQ
jgi:hypothetical protein